MSPSLQSAVICLLLVPIAAQTATDATADRPGITAPAWVRSRAVWFSKGVNPVAAEVCIGAEAAAWDDPLQKAWSAAGPGDRIALGSASWATLDSFTALACGDTKIKKGCYYLMLEKGRGGWTLLLLDPARVQKAQLLPAAANKERAVARLPLQLGDVASATLGFALEPDAGGGSATLKLHWGTHQLTVGLEVQGSAGSEPISQVDPRGSSRLSFGAGKDGREAFAQLDHGEPAWSDARAAAAQTLPKNGRWRLGQNWWTTLDSNCVLGLGGKKLAAGSWHLSLKKTGDDRWLLVCTPAADDVNGQIDAFAVDFAKAAIEVPLSAGKAAGKAAKLSIQFVQDAGGQRLAIVFGDRELGAAITVQ